MKYKTIEDLSCKEFISKHVRREGLPQTSADYFLIVLYCLDITTLRVSNDDSDDFVDIFSANCRFSEFEQKILEWANNE